MHSAIVSEVLNRYESWLLVFHRKQILDRLNFNVTLYRTKILHAVLLCTTIRLPIGKYTSILVLNPATAAGKRSLQWLQQQLR